MGFRAGFRLQLVKHLRIICKGLRFGNLESKGIAVQGMGVEGLRSSIELRDQGIGLKRSAFGV